jgi:tripartite-type tricarboxylate transporter receptor subunit TctC
MTCRITAGYLKTKWSMPINVINKPGGNTVPACIDVYNAAPDGYTLLGDPPGSSSLLAATVKNLPFNVMDRTFIAMIATNYNVLVVAPSSPIKTLKDLAEEARRDPGSFTWTSQGGASSVDYVMRKFARLAGVDITKTKPIIARSSPEIATLTAGGQVKLGISIMSASIPTIQAGLVRPLATTAGERSPSLPDVATATELGYPIVVSSFSGISGPPKLPAAVVDKWNVALQEMVKDPDVIVQLNRIGSVPSYKNSAEFKEYVRKEAAEIDELWSGKS